MIGFDVPFFGVMVVLFAGGLIYAKSRGFDPLDIYGSVTFHRILLVLMALYLGYIVTTC